MIPRTLAIIRKEFLHIIRDRNTLILIFLIPMIQMVLLGYAARTDIDNIAMAVLDGDHSAASRRLIQAFDATGYFDMQRYVSSEQAMTDALDRGLVRAALVIPVGYEAAVLSSTPVEVGLVVDGSDPTVANTVLAAGLQTGQAQSRAQVAATIRRGGIEVRPSIWYNPGLESVNYMIPALMGMVLQFLATLVTSLSIVRERELGTMEQIIVTPIRPIELVLGKTIPYILFSFIDLLEVLLIGTFWFGVPIKGSLLLLLGLSAMFLVGSLGIGIMISTAAHTQQEAMLLGMLTLVPSIFLSGFLFPLEAMPWLLRIISYVVPLRYMLVIVRGIVIKGVGLGPIALEVAILGVFCILILMVSALRFRKSLE
ncbi:MAG: ABC transporter permease [Anaerolineae bacterium]|nr:ABC transporter permease [Anaerolineae bacterium]